MNPEVKGWLIIILAGCVLIVMLLVIVAARPSSPSPVASCSTGIAHVYQGGNSHNDLDGTKSSRPTLVVCNNGMVFKP